jgi:hypothetical protein
MPRIAEIVGEGPELARSQKEVLELLEKHPDYLFRMHNDDLAGLKAWLTMPWASFPPEHSTFAVIGGKDYSLGTLRWAISTLHSRGKIGKIKIHRRTYYGSHQGIEEAQTRMAA